MNKNLDNLLSVTEDGILTASVLQKQFNAGEINEEEFYNRLAEITVETGDRCRETLK